MCVQSRQEVQHVRFGRDDGLSRLQYAAVILVPQCFGCAQLLTFCGELRVKPCGGVAASLRGLPALAEEPG
jgi:hypothetical protein